MKEKAVRDHWWGHGGLYSRWRDSYNQEDILSPYYITWDKDEGKKEE